MVGMKDGEGGGKFNGGNWFRLGNCLMLARLGVFKKGGKKPP